MGPNFIYDRAPNMSDQSNNSVPDSEHTGCYERVPSWNGACLQEPRTTGSPVYHPHYEKIPAEQEQQKFLLNNGIQLNDCHSDVRRKLNEMFFRGTDLRYSSGVTCSTASSIEDDQQNEQQ
ncbi:hypothetical protein WDU94_004372 [Cyamophila willieti]